MVAVGIYVFFLLESVMKMILYFKSFDVSLKIKRLVRLIIAQKLRTSSSKRILGYFYSVFTDNF